MPPRTFADAAVLSPLVGGWALSLLRPRGEAAPTPARAAAGFFFLTALVFGALIAPGALVPALPDTAARVPGAALAAPLLALFFAAPAVFAFVGGRAAARAGAAFGGTLAWLVLSACLWRVAAIAWRLLGWFSGSFFLGVLPLALAASISLAAFVLVHEDARPHARSILGALLALWLFPPQAALWRLRSAWALGPRTLAEAAAVPAESTGERVAVAWLRPDKDGATHKVEERRLAFGGVDLSPDSLERLYRFVDAHKGRAVFAKQALEALRRGWLMRWDPERSLQSAMLSYPRRFAPDYRSALGLIRAGPIVLERYTRLNALADEAKKSSKGFEDVNQSQLIFEAFSAAFARFGDEENARAWILRVDNLWPIYDKKVEIAPLEGFHDGTISGSVTVGGAPASNLLVGLFFVASSTASLESGVLSQSAWPDEQGRFSFSSLGAGSYYLGVMGRPEDVREPVESSPSLISLSPDAPAVTLRPVAFP